MSEKERFNALRKMVMNAIAKELARDCGCKSYEGTFEWTACYPNYFDDPEGTAEPSLYVLTLHCYVLGPTRHYNWYGKTKMEAIAKAEREIKSWLEEDTE